LPETIRDGLAVMRGDLASQELTGDARPETVISYILPGGSGSQELLYIYRWDDAGQPQLIFNAALTTWAGTSSWELAPDGTESSARQIVLTYPYLYGDGFDHKMVNHPLARQIWRWDGGTGRFTLFDETVRGPEMSWGPPPDETTEDRLRWTVNEGEQAFRAGDYTTALEQTERVLSIAQATGWSPEEGQPDWAGYARFRRAETLALLGRSGEATQETHAVAEAYAGDMLGELAAAFMAGYAGGGPAVGLGAVQGLGADLYSHFYYEQAGALRFPMDAPGILYPGAGLAAYLDAHPELAGDGGGLVAGLQGIGYDAVDAAWGDGEVQVVLHLPDAPNAEGASVLWRLARSGDRWYVMPVEPDPVAPGSLSEPGWPTVGGFPSPRYAPQQLSELPSGDAPTPTPIPTSTPGEPKADPETPVETPQPTATSTPAPTPTEDATPEAEIQSFEVMPDRVQPGEAITVSWEISGDAEYALLQLTDTGALYTGQVNFFDYAPLSGTRRIIIPVETRGDIRLSLSAVLFPPPTGSGPRMPAHLDSAEQIVALDDPDPGVGQVQAAFQQFQSGFMIWRADIGSVLAFVQTDLPTGYDGTYSQYPEEIYAGWPDFTGDVPEGFVRPAHAFGKVWRQDDAGALPALLGYPIAAEQGYTMIIRKLDAAITYTLPDGRSVTVDEGGAYWQY
jgi:hypothetical protein